MLNALAFYVPLVILVFQKPVSMKAAKKGAHNPKSFIILAPKHLAYSLPCLPLPAEQQPRNDQKPLPISQLTQQGLQK